MLADSEQSSEEATSEDSLEHKIRWTINAEVVDAADVGDFGPPRRDN
jgi:hypothetical protein